MAVSYGGQAVLEGVMMRGPSNWSVAVRKPDGDIAHVSRSIESPMKRHALARLPIIRGIFALGESLTIGFRALAISANYAAQEEGANDEEVSKELSRGQLFFAFAVAIGFAIALFKVTPALLTNLLPIDSTGPFVDRGRVDPRVDLHPLPGADLALARPDAASSSTTLLSTRRSTRSRPATSSCPRTSSATR